MTLVKWKKSVQKCFNLSLDIVAFFIWIVNEYQNWRSHGRIGTVLLKKITIFVNFINYNYDFKKNMEIRSWFQKSWKDEKYLICRN